MNKILTVFIFIISTACTYQVKNGVRISDSDVKKLKDGKTTYQEAVKVLGNPTWAGPAADGTITAMWNSSSYNASMSPFAMGGGQTQTSSLNCSFDKNKVLVTCVQSGTFGEHGKQ